MADREKIINHFQDAIEASGDNNKWRFVRVDVIEDAIELLKEQEPVKPIDQGDDSYVCDNCGETVGWEELDVFGINPVKYKYCPGCGRKVKWNAVD